MDWNRLRKSIQGRVILPGDPEYLAAKRIHITRFDDRTPVAVVAVTSAEDVAASMVFAGENNLSVAARSGGHSYAGVSATSGALVIDLRGLSDVHSGGGGLATVGPGLNLYQVYSALDQYGQTIPTGMCPGPGIAGLTLGGGLGFESRRHGTTCDQLVTATLVLPDGTVTDVSKTQRPELFWAIRGGGPFYGVVTSFTFQTFPAAPKDVVQLSLPADRRPAPKDILAQCISGWWRWLRSAHPSQWANLSIDADGHGGLSCWLQLACPASTGDQVALALTAATGVPLQRQVQTLPHMAAVMALGGGNDTDARANFTNGSDVLTSMSDEVIGTIIEVIEDFSKAGGTGWVQLNTLDGAVRNTNTAVSAFPWRHHAALAEWGAYEPIPHEVAVAWIAEAHRRIQPFSAGAYLNYLEPGDSLRRYYGDNHARLTALRHRVDPLRRICNVLTD